MKKTLSSLLLVGVSLITPTITLSQTTHLQIQSPENLGFDESLKNPQQRQNLLLAIDRSLAYLKTAAAQKTYEAYVIEGITVDRLRRSLLRFRELLLSTNSPEDLQAALVKEFVFYEASDKSEPVLFTAYFEPVYEGSLTQKGEYRYPIYGLPSNLSQWKKPHLTRAEIEGKDGLLGKKSPIAGSELIWLKDRLEAYLIQIQGSAKIQLTDGKTMTIGYAGSTSYDYVSIGKELVKDKKFALDELSLPRVKEYFRQNPEDLNEYLPRNRQIVFFRDTKGAPATGVLGQPVTAERSIATDKSLMPPGGLALIVVALPELNAQGEWVKTLSHRYVLDQDAGGAIKGPARVDIFMGTGKIPGEKAGRVRDPGKLYYLLLKN